MKSESKVSAWKNGFGSGEFLAEVEESGIVGGRSETMKADGEGLGYWVWEEVSGTG